MKRCKRCQQMKGVEEFPIAVALGKPYRRGICKPCLREYFKVHGLLKRSAAKRRALREE